MTWLPAAIGVLTLVRLSQAGSVFFGGFVGLWFFIAGIAFGYSRNGLAYLGLWVLPFAPPLLMRSVGQPLAPLQPSSIAYGLMCLLMFWLLRSKEVLAHPR